MDLIYEGNNPPASFDGPVLRAITEAEAASMFAAGRQVNGDYTIVVADGRARKCWYPPPAPVAPPEYEYPTEFGIIMARLDVLSAKIEEITAP